MVVQRVALDQNPIRPSLIFSPPMERKTEKLKKQTVNHYEAVEGKDGGDLEEDLGGRVEKRRG